MTTSQILKILSFVIIPSFLWMGCASQKVVLPKEEITQETLDTLEVIDDMPDEEIDDYKLEPFNPSATRTFDILHTKLEIAFDWEQQHVLGKAYLTISPIFYPIDMVTLDAKEMVIHEVREGGNGPKLDHSYEDNKLEIHLRKMLNRGEKVTVFIDYTARPNEGPEGGSAAITSDKGLYFINPMGKIAGKPRQIWTQGETESNSKWFPTFDKPNERFTQEIYITVNDTLTTLSNGILVSSTKNSDGTRTDYWKMDDPHAPYLVMMAVGDFARVKDSWNGIPLAYYVDPPYKDDAKAIFNNTPEMLSFFSDILDYPYPWDKFSQIVVEDYVSGAMENTTAVIFGDFIQKHARALIDNDNDMIVAHEMFHHWFGDLVTCESWANLTLNEGFANYSEYLWTEHKKGKDAAEDHRLSEMQTYMYMAAQSGTHPLIFYGYDNKEDMFDAHSYNKGGLVLHMLRNLVGDEAFFASLSKYLKDNAYTAVEIDELRMAIEDVTGMDLMWFFDQWYHDSGHPELEVSYSYMDGQLTFFVEQTQDPKDNKAVFILPLDVAVYAPTGEVSYYPVVIDERKDTITIPGIKEEPLVATLDGKCVLLGDVKASLNEDQLVALVKYSDQYADVESASAALNHSNALRPMVPKLLNHPFYKMRIRGLDNTTEDHIDKVKKMIFDDPHSLVRSTALMTYDGFVGIDALPVIRRVLKTEKANEPLKTALELLYAHKPEEGMKVADAFISNDPATFFMPLRDIFVKSGKAKYLPYFEEKFSDLGFYEMFGVMADYQKLLLKQSPEIMVQKISEVLAPMAKTDSNKYKRFMAAKSINEAIKKLSGILDESPTDKKEEVNTFLEKAKSILRQVIESERSEELKQRYLSF